ncbi:MAG: helix-turn-helix domain-containing protein [Candidatus Omnitrophota bacterium]
MTEQDRAKKLQEFIRDTEHFFPGNKKKEVYKNILEMVERPLLEMVLEKTDGNQKKAAKILGINRNTLHAKIKKLKIDVKKFKFDY